MITASKYNPSKLHFSSLEDLMDDHQYIGLQSSNYTARYIIVTGGPKRGCTVSPSGIWASEKDQYLYKKGYVIFETKEDLFEWMKG